jgi:hypothetical protein
MTTSLDTSIRRSLGMIVAVIVVVCVGAGSAVADGRPAASYYTKQQLQVMAERGAAKAAHDLQVSGGRPAASYHTKQKLQALAQRGAMKAAHDSLTIQVAHPAASYYTKQQLQAMSQSWAARGALSSVSNAEAALATLSPETRNALLARLGQTPVVTDSESSFGWGDFGIGAAGMLGLVLLAGGAFFVLRFGRRSGSAPVQRPV